MLEETAVLPEDEEQPELEIEEETESLEIADEEVDSEPELDEEEAEEENDDEVVVQIGDEETPPQEVEKAPDWVRELRKSHKDQQRENRELKKRLEELSETKQPEKVTLGNKPTMESAEYDSDVYERQLAALYENKRKHDEQIEQAKAEQENQQKAWQSTLDSYAEKRKQIKVSDFEDAEMIVQDELDNTQQGMILQGAENPALLVYALGKNPKKAKELASINDPVKFAFAVAKLETQLKVTNRKASTKPETVISGKAPKSGSVDSNLERLRAEAERTGDYTKVTAYKRQKRQAR